MTSEGVARRLRVHGVVQGVGYREGLREIAESHDVAGWVRNLRDGTVEAVVEGSAAAVDAVITWARRGPRSARVERLEVADEPVTDREGFERLSSL